jgi:hypothetical protein
MKTIIEVEADRVYLTLVLLLLAWVVAFGVATYATLRKEESTAREVMCATSSDCVCVDGPDGGRVCGGHPVPRSLHPLLPRDIARVP